MRLPISRAQQAALDWLEQRGGAGRLRKDNLCVTVGHVVAPMRPDTWRKLAAKGYVDIDGFRIAIVPIEAELQLAESDVEDTVIAARATAERFSHVKR